MMIRSAPAARFSFGRLGSAQTTSEIYTGIETGAAFIPVVGPFIADAAAIAQSFGIGKGCGPTCTSSTQVVNQAEPIMKQNLAAAQAQAQANGGWLTPDEMASAVNNFNAIWAQVVKGCGQIPPPGGTQCISDRQPGGKYDWTSYYLQPIQAIPVNAAPSAAQLAVLAAGTAAPYDPTGSAAAYYPLASSAGTAAAAGTPNLLLWGALAIGGVLLARNLG
jgi:hypothetical protein